MNRVVLVFVFFIILFSKALGQRYLTNEELKQVWRNTGFDLNSFLQEMNKKCHKSEKFFSACMMAFHELFSRIDGNNPQQLRVSNLNELEIVPYTEKNDDLETLDSFVTSRSERRKSFHVFFHSKTEGKQGDSSTPIRGILDDIFKQSTELINKGVPEEDIAFFLGETYNVFLSEAIDPQASVYPLEMDKPQTPASNKYAGIGVKIFNYKSEDPSVIGTGIMIDPVKGLPAEKAGLKKGDLILAVNGVPLQGTLAKERRLRGPEETQITLTVQSFCDNEKRDVTITRRLMTSSSDWMKDSRFVNLLQQEPTGCENETPAVNKQGPQALYVPLHHFPRREDHFLLCEQFIDLQKRYLLNPRSRGMIIDFRGNTGGPLSPVLCMLNTIISEKDVLLQERPVKDGKVVDGDIISFYFTDTGVIDALPAHSSLIVPVSYNRPVIVLVDRLSSSGSEIFAGTIQDKKRGWVIGDRTGGKGSVQTVFPFTFQGGDPDKKAFRISMTTAIYTLNSGRSPQFSGIIPDFRFSMTGEPIENETHYVSIREQLHFNKIDFENDHQWEQNRPDKVARLNTCIHQDNKMGSLFKRKAQNEEKYRNPLVADYPLELAKDILTCEDPVPSYNIRPRASSIYRSPWTLKIEKQVSESKKLTTQFD